MKRHPNFPEVVPEWADHGGDKKPQRPKCQRRARQAVQPVHEAVEHPLPRHDELRPELGHGLRTRICTPLRPGFGVFAKDLDRLAHNIVLPAEDKREHPLHQPHADTLC